MGLLRTHWRIVIGLPVLLVAGAALYFSGAKALAVISVNETFKEFSQLARSAQEKARELRELDLENELLRIKNLQLTRKLHEKDYQATRKTFSRHTASVGVRLKGHTGSEVARVLSTIQFKAPVELTPHQLLVLGLSYLRNGEDEKAAVIFSRVTDPEPGSKSAMNTSQNLLMTGLAWYRLDNLKLADTYFKLALGSRQGADVPQNHAQARLWRAIVAQRLKDSHGSQTKLRDLLDHHPHSIEAKWINSGDGE